MTAEKKFYCLVMCGGKSARMGFDKSRIVYFEKPMRYHLYEMLERISGKVFISCNSSQVKEINAGYNTLVDSDRYENTGPMAALLTAFEKFPDKDFLLIGCDYPFITEKELTRFLSSLNKSRPAAAFYNIEENLFEPLLAFYSNEAVHLIKKSYDEKAYSLQGFLKAIDAEKYFPDDISILKSVNTPEEFANAKEILGHKSELT